jgi:hypothetical protein
MSQSKLKKLPRHQAKPTNVSLWKQYREYKGAEDDKTYSIVLMPIAPSMQM